LKLSVPAAGNPDTFPTIVETLRLSGTISFHVTDAAVCPYIADTSKHVANVKTQTIVHNFFITSSVVNDLRLLKYCFNN
jgi:hypothetical protein